ncbi:Retrovirus-related Pol polyprotein from transposon [Smittium culicis]|uniref:Retrovirus-related Pol polyprotein from transposon n=1 Tax=Smittium culicis TaxID=133412 RepID=A0A1R1YI87_9FUNG|nr:Retrovirus-related Pol polyprotein from transposon [Smittium culicis]
MAHLGTSSTYSIMKMRYWWPYLKEDINSVIRECPECQTAGKFSGNKAPIQPLKISPSPFYRWGIDFIGPMPISNKGNSWILLAIDHSTNWIVARATKNSEAETVAKFIYKDLMLAYGAPSEILSDRGPQFSSIVLKKYLKIQQIKHQFTSAYHPQSNGKTERANGVIGKAITKLSIKDKSKWDDFLDLAVWATRIRSHSITGISPYFLVYGIEPRIPGDPNPPEKLLNPLESYTSTIERLSSLQERRKGAFELQEKSAKDMVSRDNKNKNNIMYQEGSMVLISNEIKKKLDPPLLGPFRIKYRAPFYTYKLETPSGVEVENLVHHNRLIPANTNPENSLKLWTKPGVKLKPRNNKHGG